MRRKHRITKEKPDSLISPPLHTFNIVGHTNIQVSWEAWHHQSVACFPGYMEGSCWYLGEFSHPVWPRSWEVEMVVRRERSLRQFFSFSMSYTGNPAVPTFLGWGTTELLRGLLHLQKANLRLKRSSRPGSQLRQRVEQWVPPVTLSRRQMGLWNSTVTIPRNGKNELHWSKDLWKCRGKY